MSSTILTVMVLVVMWIVVLVPILVRRDEADDEYGYDDDVSGDATVAPSSRLLSKSLGLVPAAVAAELPDGAWDADDHGAWDADDHGAWDADDHRPPYRTSRAEMLVRRRRTLATLASLATLTLVAAVTLATAWWAVQTGLDLMLTGYLVWLRSEARREAVRRQSREARMQAGHSANGVEARPVAPITPVIPRPATRGTVAAQVVPLDDDDLTFVDIEERYPRAVNG